MIRVRWLFLLIVVGLVADPAPAAAYVGPGAGFAVGGGLSVLFTAVASAIALFVSWPIRFLFRLLFRKRPPKKAQFQRVVILGLDGLDHGLTTKLLEAGKLPNLAKLG